MTGMNKLLLSPYERREETYTGMCRDVLFCVAALCVFSYVYFGIRPILLTLVSMAAAVVAETFCCLMAKKVPTVLDGSAMVTGALVGLLMSPIAPPWLAVTASLFAVLLAKMPFGGVGKNLFNPAAAGVAFVTALFPTEMFTYPDPEATLPMGLTAVDVVTELSPAALLHAGGTTSLDWTELLFGRFPGPIGATPVLILCGCGAYLLIRRSGSALITLPYLATCALCAALFPRTEVTAAQSVLLELCSGYLLFAGIFMLNDPTTSPSHWLGRIVYGVLAGALVMLMRHWGRFEEGACFAILLCNALSRALDVTCWKCVDGVARRIRRRTL